MGLEEGAEGNLGLVVYVVLLLSGNLYLGGLGQIIQPSDLLSHL
jgi:hypothetical protein